MALTGSDALAFAQAQVMSDVSTLGDGDWQWSGWLTPKGRLVAFFALYRRDAQSLIAWLPAGGAEALRERWQRYVFRSKVKIETHDDWHAVGQVGNADAPADAIARLPLVDQHGASRTIVIAAAGSPLSVQAGEDTQSLNAWRLRDLRLGVPYIAAGGANSEQFVPQWLSLERLGAYGLKKGCYPGQEIVARTHFLGQAKRGLVLLGSQHAPPPGSDVEQSGRPIGTVVSSGTIEGATGRDEGPGPCPSALALAVLPLERDDAPMRADGQALGTLALRNGLAR